MGESEVSVCGPGGNPQASVVFVSLPDTVLVLKHTPADTHSGRPPVSHCVTLLGGKVGHVTCPKSVQPASVKLKVARVSRFSLFLLLLTVLY